MSNGKMSTAGRSIGAVLSGYAILVLGALMFQDALFGRLTYHSPSFDLVIGGGLTVVSAVVGGYVLAIVAPKRPMLHAVALAVWLCFETTMLYLSGDSPLWFDILTGGSNIIGVFVGTYVWLRLNDFQSQSSVLEH